MGEFLVDGPEADLSTTAVHVDGKDTNLTPFKTLIPDPCIETSKENAKWVPFKTFQDPRIMDRTPNNEERLVVSDHELPEQTQLLEQLTEDLVTEFETPFKTLHLNGIRVSGEKNNEESHFKTPVNGTQGSREQCRQKLTPFKIPVHVLDRDLVKNRSRQTSSKTMGKSGRENIASQDMVRKVSENLIPFKTPNIKYRTSRVHFKTFDNWVKARRMKCNTVLKDVSSFISDKMEMDQPKAMDALMRSCPSCKQPNSCRTKRNGDPQTYRSSPINRG